MAQPAKIILPNQKNWNVTREGTELNFKLSISPDSVAKTYQFSIQQ